MGRAQVRWAGAVWPGGGEQPGGKGRWGLKAAGVELQLEPGHAQHGDECHKLGSDKATDKPPLLQVVRGGPWAVASSQPCELSCGS